MRNKKKLERVIAFALLCGSCAVNVTEASGAYVYGNSPNRPSDYITSPSAGDNASEFVFDFDSSIHAGTVWSVYG